MATAVNIDVNPTRYGASIFKWLLVFVTIVPYAAYLLLFSVPKSGSNVAAIGAFLSVMIIIGSTHVPATLYLFTDPNIRQRIKSQPFSLLVIPLLGILFYPTIIIGLWQSNQPSLLYIMFSMILALWIWQAWHFGMQSYGVFSFVSMTSKRQVAQPILRTYEKRCVIAGTVGGMLNVYAIMAPQSYLKHLNIDYTLINALGHACHMIGMTLCGCAAIYAAMHIWRHRASFTPTSAVMFFLGASFFLPDIFPQLMEGDKYSLNSVNDFALIHGMQYVVFLCAHAAGQSQVSFRASHAKEPWLIAFFAALMPLVTIIIMLQFGFLMSNYGAVGSLTTSAFNAIGSKAINSDVIFIGWVVIQGFSIAHFIIDMHVWRLTRPESRNWVLSRFNHVLPARQNAAKPAVNNMPAVLVLNPIS